MEGWYVVCEYYPPGNVEGQYQQEVGRDVDTFLTKGKGEVVGYVAHVHAKINEADRRGWSWGSVLVMGVSVCLTSWS